MNRGGYLLDTSTLSLLAPGRPGLPKAVVARLREETERLYLSTITLAELRQGVCQLRRKSVATRAEAIDRWAQTLRHMFADRILALGSDEADAAGELADAAVGIGRNPGFADVAIAATARTHGLMVVTENLRHFEPLTAFGVTVRTLATLA